MEQVFITSEDFKGLVEGLLGSVSVYGTVNKDGFPVFKEISAFDELSLSLTPTHLSAKEFCFPQSEPLVRFDIEKDTAEEIVEATEQALIGLHACDIKALNLMDKVFEHGTPDKNYLARRRSTIVIGVECIPDEYCFCASLGNMTVDEGFDLFLHETKGGFIVRIGSERGGEILSKYTKPREVEKEELEAVEIGEDKKKAIFKARLDAAPEDLPAAYAKAVEHPVWERIGSICYGCGSCNHVCPTCYCFDVKDEITMDLKGSTRYRVWDGCTTEEFAKVAGGHNFRTKRAERLRHRFMRKFRYLSDVFDSLFCVGCGRCSRTCLVQINISEVTNEVVKKP